MIMNVKHVEKECDDDYHHDFILAINGLIIHLPHNNEKHNTQNYRRKHLLEMIAILSHTR